MAVASYESTLSQSQRIRSRLEIACTIWFKQANATTQGLGIGAMSKCCVQPVVLTLLLGLGLGPATPLPALACIEHI